MLEYFRIEWTTSKDTWAKNSINMQTVMETLPFKRKTNRTNENGQNIIETQWLTWKNETKRHERCLPPDWLYIPIRFQHSEATHTPKRERKLKL